MTFNQFMLMISVMTVAQTIANIPTVVVIWLGLRKLSHGKHN